MRITDTDKSLIRNTFKGRDDLLKLMRKFFLPEITEDTPIGQIIDLWMTIKIEDMTPEEAVINLKARNSLIQHIEQRLVELQVLSASGEDTPEESLTKLRKNSSK
jgi:hypothetical protein